MSILLGSRGTGRLTHFVVHSGPEVAVGEPGAIIVDDQLGHGSPGLITTRRFIERSARVCRVLGQQLLAARQSLLEVLIRPPALPRRRRRTWGAWDICLGDAY